MQDKMIERLKKLLALAKDSRGNENEASSAMEKVQELLAEYNLSMADLEASGSTNEDSKREKSNVEKNALYEYQRILMRFIADAHYCRYWTGETLKMSVNHRWTKRFYHVVIGREANVVATKLMFEYLNSTIERLSNELYPQAMHLNLSKSAISWKHGCSHRLCERLKERRDQADEAQAAKVRSAQATAQSQASPGTPGTSLMLLTDVRQTEADLNSDFLSGWAPGTTAANRAKYRSEDTVRNAKFAADQAKREAELKAMLEAMTPFQRAQYNKKKEEAEKKQDARWEREDKSRDKKETRKWANKDMDAFWEGHEVANSIGLDVQVGQGSSALKIGGKSQS